MKGRTLKWLIELKEVLNNEVSGKTGIRAATGNLAIGPFKWFNIFYDTTIKVTWLWHSHSTYHPLAFTLTFQILWRENLIGLVWV